MCEKTNHIILKHKNVVCRYSKCDKVLRLANYKEAKECYLPSLKISKDVLSDSGNHPCTKLTLNNINQLKKVYNEDSELIGESLADLC